MDAAVHVWSSDRSLFPWVSDAAGFPHSTFEADLKSLAADFAVARTAGAVLIQPRIYGADHSFLGRIVSQGEGRFAGVALWSRTDRRVDVAATIDRHGLAGVRLSAEQDTNVPWFDGKGGEEAWDLADERGQTLSVLCRPSQLGAVRRWAKRCPQVRITVDHLGLVDGATGGDALLELISDHVNVDVRVSALAALSREPWPYRDLWPLLRAVYSEAGSERLVYGTDWPFFDRAEGYSATIEALDEALEWSAFERAHVLGRNAIRLWGMDSAALKAHSD